MKSYAILVGLSALLLACTADPLPTSAQIGPFTEQVPSDDYFGIYYVSAESGCDATGDGSVQKPWQTLPFALRQITNAGPERHYAVQVGEGKYQSETLQMVSHVDLYGGFASGTWLRDILAHPTILEGQEGQRILLGADHATLDGFYITKGKFRGKGAGIYCDGVSPNIRNNIFRSNRTLAPLHWNPRYLHEVAHDGGAIYCCNGSAPVIEQNIFGGNETENGRGAAIAFQSRCSGRISRNVFIKNITGTNDPMRSSDGGAISLFDWSNPLVEDNIILNNQALASNDAGGLFVALWSAPVIRRNIFVGNSCSDDAGALFVGGQEHRYDAPLDALPGKDQFFVTIEDNLFIGNRNPSMNSGAMRFTMESRGAFRDNIVAHNSGIYFQRCEAAVERNIILDDFLLVETKAGLAPCVVKNNILWGDLNVEVEAEIKENNVRDKRPGNISQAPLFKDDWMNIKVISSSYKPGEAETNMLITGQKLTKNALVNRIVKAGDRWGVVKSNNRKDVQVWGDFSGCLEMLVLPTYEME